MNKLLKKLKNSSRIIHLLLAGVLALIGLSLFAMLSAAGSADAPISADLKKGAPGTKKLIVLVHGWTLGPKDMEDVEEAALAARPGADVLHIGYASQIFSKASPFRIASQIDARISQLQETENYDDIVLCGFSAGALLVRKAYVYGCGSIEDAPGGDRRRLSQGPREAWVDQVKRIVLMAGMNRGASLDEKPEKLSYTRWYLNHLALLVAKMSNTGHFARECMRGSPFVANLRLQWLRTMEDSVNKKLQRPEVVQLLGDKDDVVSKADSRDVAVSKEFIWVQLNNTDHLNIVQFDETASGIERRTMTTLAFGDDAALARLKLHSTKTAIDEDREVETVVFVLHGIRDMGEWTSQFNAPLQSAFERLNPPQPGAPAHKLVVHAASYGYFGMGPFLLGTDRQKNVRWFMDEVTELTAKYPNMKNLHFIGHSNGTYVLGSALENYATLKVNRVVLAGSVLRRDFPWKEFTGRVDAVRNYVGSDDVVVGLGPKVFEMPLFGLLNRDIGSAGYDGFLSGTSEERFIRGGHGAALDQLNVPSIVNFIAEGKSTTTSELHEKNHPKGWDFLTNLCWVAWILAAGLLILGGRYLPPLITTLLVKRATWKLKHPVLIWYVRAGYVGLLWLILMTI